MLDISEAKTRAHDLVQRARRAGADAADALCIHDADTQVHIRLGKLEDVGSSENEGLGLRVFIGQRSASVSTSENTSEAFDTLVERALAMARIAPEDSFAGLASEDILMRDPIPDLDLEDGTEVAPEMLREFASRAEAAARAVPGVSNSEGATAAASWSVKVLVTSHGFAGGVRTTSHACSASVLAGTGSEMQRDYDHRTTRHIEDMAEPESIGLRAGERAVVRMGSQSIKGGAMPVVFDPRVAGSLLGHLIGAISGSSIARRSSFLLDAEGGTIFPEAITVRDDPLRPRGLGSRGHDGEGLTTQPSTIIDRGRLTGWLVDASSGRQLERKPTGHAIRHLGGSVGVRPSNLYMEAGEAAPEELIADITRGVLVTELIGQGINLVTGDYSRGASGFLIENGEIVSPVSEITVAGNLRDMFAHMTAANDLEMIRGIDAPSLRVEGMTVAGG